MDVAVRETSLKSATLHDQIIVRLIPAQLLQPRIHLVEGDEIITGGAFDIESILEENRTPSPLTRAQPAVAARVLFSIEASRFANNRFNGIGDQGAYYAGTTLPACIEEIRYHLKNSHPDLPYDRTRIYRAVTARTNGRFLDLRGTNHPALDPDPEAGYHEGHLLAQAARDMYDGIIYPSARHSNGTCIAVFRAESITEIKLGQLLSFEPVTNELGTSYGYRNHTQPHLMASIMEMTRN